MAQQTEQQGLKPAFMHRWQWVFFLLFISFFFLLPFLPKPDWLDRTKLYLAFGGKRGHTDFLANHLLQDSSDIDILFLGQSGMESAINPLIIKKALRPILGREPVVKVVGHGHFAADYDYIALRDILARRKVRLLIWQRNRESVNEIYAFSYYLWDFYLHRPALENLPANLRTSIYFNNVMNGLRLVLTPVKDRLSSPHVMCHNQTRYSGACLGWQGRKFGKKPPHPVLSTRQLIHSRYKDDPMLIEKGEYTPYGRAFSDAIFRLAQAHGTYVALIQVPYSMHDVHQKIIVPAMEPDQPGYYAPILGTVVSDLFPGLDMPAIKKTFYVDEMLHFHIAGANYYTRAMLPGIIKVFQGTAMP